MSSFKIIMAVYLATISVCAGCTPVKYQNIEFVVVDMVTQEPIKDAFVGVKYDLFQKRHISSRMASSPEPDSAYTTSSGTASIKVASEWSHGTIMCVISAIGYEDKELIQKRVVGQASESIPTIFKASNRVELKKK